MFKKEEPNAEYHTLTSAASTFNGLSLGKEHLYSPPFVNHIQIYQTRHSQPSHMHLFHRNMVRYSYTVSIFVWR